ncbi:MAG TPA: MFS transporter [Vicinamibacteria bacterium]|nr:MFS transporter [Vicinamibacteria bacterium]
MSAETAVAQAVPGAEEGRLSFGEKVGYSLGDAASNFYWKTFEFFLMFFYTEVFGISAAAVGTMLLITRIGDAVADPIMGTVADRTRTRWGHFRPYILWFAMPLAVAGVLTFTTPDMGHGGKVVYAYVTYSLLMLMYTAVNIPYSALMGVMTSNSKERTSLSSFRFIGAFTVATFVQYCTRNLAQYFGLSAEQNAGHSLLGHPLEWVGWFFSKDFMSLPQTATQQAHGWQMTMALYGVLAVIMLIGCFAITRERVVPPAQQEASLKKDLLEVARNRSFLALLGVLMLVLTAFVVKGSVSAYYFKYFVRREDLLGPFLVSNGLAFLAAVFCTNLIKNYFDKKVLFIGSIGVGGLIVCLFWLAGPASIGLLFALQIGSSFVLGANSPLVWAMFADTADDAEWRTGRRNTGLVFAAAIFGTKVGVAIGAWVLGIILAMFGYVANAEQTASSLLGIRLSMSLIPGVILVVAAALMKYYPLDDKLMIRIEKDLKARKAEA